jgi:hypothetical protein
MARKKTVANETLTSTQVIPGGTRPPTPGLFFQPFPLTEADFDKLQQTSPVLSGIASAFVTFACVYGLPILVKYVIEDVHRRPVSRVDALVTGISLGIGLVLFGLRYVFSRERRRVLNAIQSHFRDNRPEPVTRTQRK